MNEKYVQAYLEEAEELLVQLEETLLELEDDPNSQENISTVFRILHTLKGSGAMFGFETISAFTHEVETYFDFVRNGKYQASRDMINLILKAKDQIKKLLYLDPETKEQDAENKEIIDKFEKLLNNMGDVGTETKEARPMSDDKNYIVKIDFNPHDDILLNGTDIILLFQELGELGTFQAVADMENIPFIEELEPEHCYMNWELELNTHECDNTIKDVFIFVEDDCELNVSRTGIEDKIISDNEIAEAPKVSPSLETVNTKQVREKVESPSGENKKEDSDMEKETRYKPKIVNNIKVSSDKLDTLVDLVGELVTLQSSLQQYAMREKESELISIVEESGRLITDLREKTMGMRMVPIGTLFNRFKRLVRDLSQDLKKEIDLELEGAKTEMDKNVIDQLADPLVHLIRNSIDHGIESPKEREGKGKNANGIVRLSAVHSGAYVLIKISDNGKGLDKEKIKAKGIEKGLIREDDVLTDQEIFALIFEAGFSTAGVVTNLSGRGVGMDVVRKTIENLKGSITIDSKLDKGTDITLKLPLTLAIIDGLLVQINDDYYVFPLSMIEECVELDKDLRENRDEKKLFPFRGEFIPFVDLKSFFHIQENDVEEIEQMVISNMEGKRVGFIVDKVIGQHQTVIKTLGKLYRNCRGISGATILGNGKVALIVDIPQLVQVIIERENYLLENNQ